MNWKKPARFLLKFLAAFAVLSVFVVLDWYPTVKGLGRLRHELNELERKIRDHEAAAAQFKFPDEKEDSLLAAADAERDRALPLAKSDDHWLDSARTELRRREMGLADRLRFFSAAEQTGPGASGLAAWLGLQAGQIRQGYPWSGVLPLMPPGAGKLACQPLAIALDAQLPGMLNWINRVSWGDTRLEIVRLRLEPGTASCRAWLVCRGSYYVSGPSSWLVEPGKGGGEEKLLIDPDSPLLLQRIDPFLAPGVEKRELPPAGSPW